ncbi:MAG: hypothetical protein LUC93_00695 [Planctomycetaceae bacterium]|nr:hypothetical protein [Planctomycetaceae bacterium]
MPGLNIKVGKYYRTRGGHKARIYALDGNGGKAIHGAVANAYGEWLHCIWNSRGMNFDDRESEIDLVSLWVDPPMVD